MKDDRAYGHHIIECLDRIEKYTAGGRSEFLSNTMVQDSVLRLLQIMAESATRLSEGTKATMPEIDWKRIGAFRNVVAHDYLGLELERIWGIIERELPPLRKAIDGFLRSA